MAAAAVVVAARPRHWELAVLGQEAVLLRPLPLLLARTVLGSAGAATAVCAGAVSASQAQTLEARAARQPPQAVLHLAPRRQR